MIYHHLIQELGDCYIILGHLWVYVDSTDIGAVNGFKDVGNIQGVDGKSAYEVAISNGFAGTEIEWLLSLKGDKGEQGADGDVDYRVLMERWHKGRN